jgi:hypothetical protein
MVYGVFFLTACVTAPTPPPGTLDQGKMISILSDIHVAEAQAQQAGFKTSDSTQLYYKHLERQILKKNKTDSTQYHDSYKFYSQNVLLMNEIYTAVVDTLEARHERIKNVPDTSAVVKNQPGSAIPSDSILTKKTLKKML